MKYIVCLIIFFSIINMDWDRMIGRKNKTKDSVSGEYVFSYENTWTKGTETLVIEKASGNNYTIMDKFDYHFLNPEHPIPTAHHSNLYLGSYDEHKKVLKVMNSATVYQFDPDKRSLSRDSLTFKKTEK